MELKYSTSPMNCSKKLLVSRSDVGRKGARERALYILKVKEGEVCLKMQEFHLSGRQTFWKVSVM